MVELLKRRICSIDSWVEEDFEAKKTAEARCKTQNLRAQCRRCGYFCCTENTAAASGWLRDRTHTSGCRLRPLMQIFANLLRWLVQGGARRAHVKRADDLLKKLSRSLSSK